MLGVANNTRIKILLTNIETLELCIESGISVKQLFADMTEATILNVLREISGV